MGSHLAAKLIACGADVICLVRDPRKADWLARLGVMLAQGDITERESMRAPMAGSDAVFHIAAWYQIGIKPRDAAKMYATNVEGTRNTIGLAVELGISKIVYTSTIAFFGNTHGQLPDETYRGDFHALTSEYERTKWRAHYEVAVPFAQSGAPLVIVQPGPVVGEGDNSNVPLIYRLYFGRIPLMPGKRSGLCWTHVDDVVAGHLLALEKGRVGESYILAGQPMTYPEALKIWQTLTGVSASRLWLPDWLVSATARLMRGLERWGVRIPPGSEAVRTLANYTFYGSSEKARRELGWTPRPITETFADVFHMARES